ncbi:hypothetical protein [Actinomyces faecalis]|uniref:hypothetical protein n=1 Tax=Actinomyces faecalis TaxID=2722820 RepID=UPI001558053B|nr:hypothetical protein [Actinomyces faecalis]
MGRVRGDRINPYNVSFTKSLTVGEYSTPHFRFELRLGHGSRSWWLWLRVTVIKGSNYLMSQGVELQTPYGTVQGLPHGTGLNWTVGSQRCSDAIAIGYGPWPVKVTFKSSGSGGPQSKTVTVNQP